MPFLALAVMIYAVATGLDRKGWHFHPLFQFQLLGFGEADDVAARVVPLPRLWIVAPADVVVASRNACIDMLYGMFVCKHMESDQRL